MKCTKEHMKRILKARIKQLHDAWAGADNQNDPQVYGEYLGGLDILFTLIRDVNRFEEEESK